MTAMQSDWLVPQWQAPARVHALCSLRTGGVSAAPYAALNLGDHVGDRPEHVAVNRTILQRRLGVRPVFLQQVHGHQVLTVQADTPDACQADASVTQQQGLACTILVADCLPVLLTDSAGSVVAAAHAGWRGLAGQAGVGVLEQLVGQLCELARIGRAQRPAALMAWLGPCIGPGAFEVGDEVRAAFMTGHAQAASCFMPQSRGKWLANLSALARQRLARLGVTRIFGNDGSVPWCTVSQPQCYFSHRRDRVSGRFAACIWLD